MMRGGALQNLMGRMLEDGLNLEWLEELHSIEGKKKNEGLTSAGSGLPRSSIRDLHERGVIKRLGRNNQGGRMWGCGPTLRQHLAAAKRVIAKRREHAEM